MSGTGISVTGKVSKPDDGLLEVFVLSTKNMETLSAAADRALNLNTKAANELIWQCKEITIDTDPDQPVWTDGEHTRRTPITVQVVPGALPVLVPDVEKA
jgi:diacylglycerol kinase family enzyme